MLGYRLNASRSDDKPTGRAGRLAQLVERHVYTVDVGSSSLSPPTILSGRPISLSAGIGARMGHAEFPVQKFSVDSRFRSAAPGLAGASAGCGRLQSGEQFLSPLDLPRAVT